MSIRPAAIAWVLAAFVAVGLAGSVYQIPIQVDDSLDVIEVMAAQPSAGVAFVDALHASRTKLRPLKQVRTKLLLEAGEALGGRYHLAFRGYHALTAALLVALFVYLADVRAWADVGALAFALTVLIGMHTFSGLLREAYPVNIYLLIALYGLAMLALARSRGGWWADAAAILLLVVGLLTLESGVLLWPIAIAGYVAGLRGISRRGLYGLTAAMIGYLVLRVGYLNIEALHLGARATGFGAGVLSGPEQIERFGHAPVLLYAYNVVMAAVAVLLSQPIAGHWSVLEVWSSGSMTPVFYVEMGSSLATTLLIAWYMLRRAPAEGRAPGGAGSGGTRGWVQPIPCMFLTVLAANAMLSYAYAKPEIISVAGVFYALAAFGAMREWLDRQRRLRTALVVGLVFALVSGGWAIRAAGLHFKLRHGAFDARGEWAAVLPPASREKWPRDPQVRALLARLKEEAVLNRRIAPARLPQSYQDWWGED